MPIKKSLRFRILQRDGFKCRYCGIKAAESELTVDHIIPRKDGGKDNELNLVAACAACNRGKHDAHLKNPNELVKETLKIEQAKKRKAGKKNKDPHDLVYSWKWRIYKAKMNMRDFAALTGRSQSQISEWVNGTKVPTLENIEAMEKDLNALGV